MLRGGAVHLWDTIQCIEDTTQMTWACVCETLRNKYFSSSIYSWKLNKFTQLRQGNLSVIDYIKKFENELSFFAPHMVSTDELKVEHIV